MLFLAIPSLLINCQKDDYIEDLTVLEKRHFTTISKSYAKEIFNGYIEAGKKKNKMFSSKSKELKVNPNWNSFQEVSLSEADANFGILDVTTNAMTSMRSKMVFLGVNDGVINAIQTENVSRDESNNIVDGVVFFHTLNGKFVVAYRYENGKPTMKYLKKNTVYKANFISLSALLFNDCVNDLDTTTPTCETTIDGGELEGFTLVTQVRNNENYTNFPIDLLIQEQEPIIAEVTDLLNPDDRNGGGGADNSASCAGGTVYDPATNSCVDAEEQIINELTDNCAKSIFTELENGIYQSDPLKPELEILALDTGKLNFSQQILHLFASSNETHLTILNNNNIGDSNAQTVQTTITISDDYLKNATQLSIARTMIHETIHAYINGLYYTSSSFHDLSFASKLRKYAADNGYTAMDNTLQHNFMGQYVNAMAYSLYEWDKQYGTGGNLNWDYYKAMAFGGLFQTDPITGKITTETDSFVELVPNSNDRQAIADIVMNEKNGNYDAQGTKCD